MGILEKIKRDRERRRERDRRIVAAHESGQTYAAIGREFGVSGANVKARIERYFRARRKEQSDDPFVKLSSRTLKILQQEGLTTVEKVVERYRRNELLCIRNFGRKSLREIEKCFPVAAGQLPSATDVIFRRALYR